VAWVGGLQASAAWKGVLGACGIWYEDGGEMGLKAGHGEWFSVEGACPSCLQCGCDRKAM